MGKDTAIGWAEHTFNHVRGCAKVSPGCKFCYAERMAQQDPETFGEWGVDGKRVVAPSRYWKYPVTWNAAAQKEGRMARVFCASLADVFEHRGDYWEPRLRLFDVIRRTPWLMWMLLTKHPENIMQHLIRAELQAGELGHSDLAAWLSRWLRGEAAPHNVCLMTSVESQEWALRRVPYLLDAPARYRMLSVEPMIGYVDLQDVPGALSGGLHGVIAGGESGGRQVRKMDLQWVRFLRNQCVRHELSFFFKQWGSHNAAGHYAGPRHDAGGDVLDGQRWQQHPFDLNNVPLTGGAQSSLF